MVGAQMSRPFLKQQERDPMRNIHITSNDDDDNGCAYYFEENGLHFTEYGRRHFTEEEREQLETLYRQRGKKFDEICAHLAAALGHGDLPTLSKELMAQIVEEADELTDQWDSEAEMEQSDKAATPEPGFQTLLAEHHALGETIMNIQDGAIAREIDIDD
jgi:hypothetical protein